MVRKTSAFNKSLEPSKPGSNGSSGEQSESTRQQGKIVRSPGICGGKARVHGTRIPVWGLEQARQSGCSDRQILEMFPDLVPADLKAAWAYVESHPKEIGFQILANEE
jgi:uncharacterized protein (DUF433 family)